MARVTTPPISGGHKEQDPGGHGPRISRRDFEFKIVPVIIGGAIGAYALYKWEEAQQKLHNVANLGAPGPSGVSPNQNSGENSVGSQNALDGSSQSNQAATGDPKNVEPTPQVDLEALIATRAQVYADTMGFNISDVLKSNRIQQIDLVNAKNNHFSMIVDAKPDPTPSSALEGGIPVPLAVTDENGVWVASGLKDLGGHIGRTFGHQISNGLGYVLRDNFTLAEETNGWIQMQAGGKNSFDYGDVESQLPFARFAHITDVRMLHLIFASQSGGTNLPQWLIDRMDPRNASELMGYITNYITTVMKKYQGKINEYVVVNEPIWADPFWKNIGPEYIVTAFQVARNADPSAKLLLNWYNNHWPQGRWTEDTRKVLGMIQGLVDKVGMQAHLGASSVLKYDRPGVIDTVKSYRALGVEPVVTEWDVDADRISSTPGQGRLFKAAFYFRDFMDTLLAAGVNDISCWAPKDAKVPNGDSTLFSADTGNPPNPAYFAIEQSIVKFMMNGPAR
ncbi:MAG TPA: endo-1,4-beta-xylanase [Patescibacteria group bacterium]|nr:endo-1,4-beta-xylanase [Patescibacteria group bacterium]